MIQYLLQEMRDQEMDFPAFVHLMTAHASEGNEEDIKKVFQLYDVDNTNYISIDNLRQIAKQLGETTSDKDLQEMISRVDTTGRHTTYTHIQHTRAYLPILPFKPIHAYIYQ